MASAFSTLSLRLTEGEANPPGFVFWFNLYEETGKRCGHAHFFAVI
jgi:hypothetical protein